MTLTTEKFQARLDERNTRLQQNLSMLEPYKGALTPIDFLCDNKHTWKTRPNKLLATDAGCPQCKGIQRYTINDLETLNADITWTTGDKITAHGALLAKCKHGHQFQTTAARFSVSPVCKHCKQQENSTYIQQAAHALGLKSTHGRIEHGTTRIYVHDVNNVLEHKVGRRHLLDIRTNDIQSGFSSIHIFSDEWKASNELVLRRIMHITKQNPKTKVHARSLTIREVPVHAKSAFLMANHNQGADRSQVNLGAYLGDQLLACMTFCRPRVLMSGPAGEGHWELSRFATDLDYRIPGCASKLLAHFKSTTEYATIYSYADMRWGDGNVYKQLGFVETRRNPPDYFYLVNGERKHRWGYRKDAIRENFDGYDASKTEYQNMLAQGYDRIWGCGTIRFEVTK